MLKILALRSSGALPERVGLAFQLIQLDFGILSSHYCLLKGVVLNGRFSDILAARFVSVRLGKDRLSAEVFKLLLSKNIKLGISSCFLDLAFKFSLGPNLVDWVHLGRNNLMAALKIGLNLAVFLIRVFSYNIDRLAERLVDLHDASRREV